MRKISTILLVFTLSVGLKAAGPTQECFKAAMKAKKELPCLQLKENTNIGNLYIRGEKTELIGLGQGLILKDDNGKIQVHSGDQTQLENPVALYWDHAQKEIYVLDESGDVLIYTDFLLGNVAPKRTLKNKELPGSVDLSLLSNEIIVLNAKTQRVLVYSSKANSRAMPKNRNDEFLRVLDLPSHLNFKGISAKSSGDYYLLDERGDIYRHYQGRLSLAAQATGALDISFDQQSGSLILHLSNEYKSLPLK